MILETGAEGTRGPAGMRNEMPSSRAMCATPETTSARASSRLSLRPEGRLVRGGGRPVASCITVITRA